MRGLYSARYLYQLQEKLKIKDLGKCFDLIVGTSTGAILGCGLAKGVKLEKIIKIYRENGKNIFPKKLTNFNMFFYRKHLLAKGEKNLKKALTDVLEKTTLAEIYNNRQIAIAIPSINLETQKSWVFKTPHNSDTNNRDDNYTLVDVCMATSAAPIYRSVALLKIPKRKVNQLFVDGGLWANNPIMVALTEALRVTRKNQPIEIFSLGTLSPNTGEIIKKKNLNWGILNWRGGASIVELTMNSQTYANKQMAKMLCKSIDRDINIIRFPEPNVSATDTDALSLDSTDDISCDFLEKKAYEAFDKLNQDLNLKYSKILNLKNKKETENV